MASMTVFVDDVVRGRLPGVCAIDGVPTDDVLRVSYPVGPPKGLGILWLLVFLGPFGWLALAVLALFVTKGSEELTVELPYSDAAYERLDAARRLRTKGLVVGAVALAGLAYLTLAPAPGGFVLGPAAVLLAGIVLLGAVVAATTGHQRRTAGSVRVELDASRRWVTLSRVHPNLIEAYERRDLGRVRDPR